MIKGQTTLDTTVANEPDPQVSLNQVTQQQELALQVLEILNQPTSTIDTIREVLLAIKHRTGIEAVGIRLKDGDDYPYYEIAGFPENFDQAEANLCAVDENGKLIRDTNGKPHLDCMCGNVIRGRTNPDSSFYTKSGSFWFNGTKELLASIKEDDSQARIRIRCNHEGYESGALIPLRSGDETIGLLQLNDHRQDMFTLDTIQFFEKLGNSVGIAITRCQTRKHLQETSTFLENLINYANAPIIVWDKDLRITIFNHAFEFLTQRKADKVIGQPLNILFTEEDQEAAMLHVNCTRNGDRWDNIEIPIQCADKSIRTFLWSSSNICDEESADIIATIAQGHDITVRKRAKEALEQQSRDLLERIEELNALYKLSQLTGNVELDTQDVYQQAVDSLPSCWRHVEIACGRIIANGKEYRTTNYIKSAWAQTSEIISFGEYIGSIEVCYLEERPEMYEGPFLKEERELLDGMARNLGQYEERCSTIRKLRETNASLIEGQIALENKNTALTEIMQHVEQEKKDTGYQIQSNIDRLVVPMISKIEVNASEAQNAYLSMLRSSLSDITSPFVTRLEKNLINLTTREVEICNLIKAGLSSKDIANSLQTSEATVVTQRKTIRKKLGLAGEKINLANYLQQA